MDDNTKKDKMNEKLKEEYGKTAEQILEIIRRIKNEK